MADMHNYPFPATLASSLQVFARLLNELARRIKLAQVPPRLPHTSTKRLVRSPTDFACPPSVFVFARFRIQNSSGTIVSAYALRWPNMQAINHAWPWRPKAAKVRQKLTSRTRGRIANHCRLAILRISPLGMPSVAYSTVTDLARLRG